jgi:hypothetical protein
VVERQSVAGADRAPLHPFDPCRAAAAVTTTTTTTASTPAAAAAAAAAATSIASRAPDELPTRLIAER